MTMFRNLSSETLPQSADIDKDQRNSIPSCSNFTAHNDDLKMDLRKSVLKNFLHYERYTVSNNNNCGLRSKSNPGDSVGMRSTLLHSSGRRTAHAGTWGSTFWKDCQPLNPPNDSESGEDLKFASEFYQKGEKDYNFSVNHLEMSGSEEDNDSHGRIPADEMLSDEYYDQDGGDKKNSVHYTEFRKSHDMNSNFSKHSTSCDEISRMPKSSSPDYDYDDNNDYEDGDGDDADDPDDVDFEPYYEATGNHNGNKDNDWNDDVSDEDIEDDTEISEDDGLNYRKKSISKRQTNSGYAVKPIKSNRSVTISNRKKKRRASSEDDYFSEKESEDNGLNIKRWKAAAYPREGVSVAPTALTNTVAQNNELRSSTRAVRISYAESEESEDHDEEKKKKISKEDIEEEDTDSIEKVLWHQPAGTFELALKNNRPTDPVLLSYYESEPDWNEIEFFIKWKGQSHLHCQWKTFSDLQNLSGFKKVLNYTKKAAEDINHRRIVSREEIEVIDVSKEMDLDLIKQNCQAERILAERVTKDGSSDTYTEYLVKWQGLSYAEATWEKDVDIIFAQDPIDEYKAREVAASIQGKMVDFQRKKSKESLRKLEEQPMWLKGGQLRDYQLDGLNFLVNSWRNDTNVILADEMGLGKTVQSVSMLGFLQNVQQIYGPFLVVVPLSTLSNWAKEFKKWLPEMNVIVFVGTRASREVCQQYEFSNDKAGRAVKFNTLLTTYEVLLKDKSVLSKIRWNYLMVDEAHRLKNSEAQLYTALSEFSTQNKLLITGTPLQNSVEELWALLHFLDPLKFKSREDFVENYKNLSSFNELELANLHKELRPHILRRVIKDVEKSLPPKIERILRVEMSPLQKQYYKWILERNFHDLNKGVRGNQVSLLNIVVELKKCCNHPFLFESADHGYGGDANIVDSSKLERMVLSSGKLVILDKLLVKLHETGHRVLLFSQMVKMLDLLAEYMALKGFQYQRLDGSTKSELRRQAMDHFNAPGSVDFCFLLSTRAGGLGINLATADTVIIFDSDWNPQNDLQAMSRAHRIGQREVVNIYRFITSRSVEENILERAKKKMVLDHLVIQKLNAEGRLEKKEAKKGGYFDKNELSAILRFGAEELFKEERNEEESRKGILNMDIDEILERAEKVEEKEAAVEDGNELLNSFKVANFCSTEDDGSFWSRLIKPEVEFHFNGALAPRAARNIGIGSYAELMENNRTGKRKKKGFTSNERVPKRKKTDHVPCSAPLIEGAVAQVRVWSHGNLPKRDAIRFIRAVKKFGKQSQIDLIAAEVGGAVEAAPNIAQLGLLNALINGCREASEVADMDSKIPVLDFFGVPVKANDLLTRVHELQRLEKRINRCKDPISQFRILTYLKPSNWSKGCGWNSIDDARLLLGVHYHGYGNWEVMRLDESLCLSKKIAPVELQHHETFLPRAPNLNERASALLQLERETGTGKEINTKGGKKAGKKGNDPQMGAGKLIIKDNRVKVNVRIPTNNRERPPPRIPKTVEALAKEEGEMSDTDELYKRFKQVKWMEWCEDVMVGELKTLKRLQRLQTTSDNLPREKVLSKIRKYLQLLGWRIDKTVVQHNKEPIRREKMTTCLWNYVSTFSNLSGERLSQIYSKLKEEQTGVGPSQLNGFTPVGTDNSGLNFHMNTPRRRRRQEQHGLIDQKQLQTPKGFDVVKFESWKRRRRSSDSSQSRPSFQRNVSTPIPPPNSLGILGSGPAEKRLGGDRNKAAVDM